MRLAKVKARARALAAILIGVILSLSLTSCGLGDPAYAINPPTITQTDGLLQVSMCVEASVTKIQIEVRGRGYSWTTIYLAQGQTSMHTDTLLSLESPLPGLEPTIAKSPDFGTATELMIYVSGPDSSEWVSMAGFQLPPDGIPEGRWLHWDGEITEYGCPG